MKRDERPCEEHFVVFPSVGAITKFHCSFLVSGSRGGQRHAFTLRFDFPSLPFVHVARELIRRRAEIKLNSLTESAKRERERERETLITRDTSCASRIFKYRSDFASKLRHIPRDFSK